MLIVSMTVSLDGYITDRDGEIGWSVPTDELFAFHLARVSELGAHICGRRLYETMLPWETDPALAETELGAQFADVWKALPKVVFSRTLDRVEGNARLATRSVAEEISALGTTDQEVEIGGAELAGQAIELGLVDELRIFRAPVIIGGGRPLLPPVTQQIRLELIETRTFAPGVIYECHRRV